MVSVAIFTYNEEVNLPHCLDSLVDCKDVVIIDSFSSDNTCSIAQQRALRVFQHPFSGFGDQRMWALKNVPFLYPWILILDADERMTPELWQEISERIPRVDSHVGAFRLKRRFFWNGIWLRHANLYPTWVVRLIRNGRVTFFNRGHAETQSVDGNVEFLENDLIDENHKGLIAWRERQRYYAQQEAQYEISPNQKLKFSNLWNYDPLDRRSAWKMLAAHLPLRGIWYFIYAYFFRSGWRDGWTGLQFCLEKARFQGSISRIARRLKNGTYIVGGSSSKLQ